MWATNSFASTITMCWQRSAALALLGRRGIRSRSKIELLREAESSSLVIALLVKLVSRVSLNAGGDRQSPCALLEGPSFYVADECRTDPRSACVFENDQRREPGNRVVVVDGRNNVCRNQSDDFAISIRCDEGGRCRKRGNRSQALGNVGD